jgi:hypothetical protein
MVNSKRSAAELKKVLKQKGYLSGKAPKGKEAHHVKPVAEGGKTTKVNIRVISKAKHIEIHKNRRERGRI